MRRDVRRQAMAGGLQLSAAMAVAGLMPQARGLGAIFTLHHVRPHDRRAFEPNRHLEVTPDFLSSAIEQLRSDGYEFVRLSDIPRLLAEPAGRPFAAFTLDDAYRNNAEHALPVFAAHDVPFTIFVAQGFAERTHTLWWETLTDILGREREIRFDFGAGEESVPLTSVHQKLAAFERFVPLVMTGKDEAGAISRIDALARLHGIDPLAITADLTMSPDELKALFDHPLVDYGAHTVSHRAISRLSPEEARYEMQQSADYLQALTGERPVSIAYPYGTAQAICERDQAAARELGLTVGVTTRPGTLHAVDLNRLTALPRISLNGYFQRARYVSALASGIPFRLGR
ncbi:polysaccharide deacetylase family protein [Neorhizobium lilium]|nr:polysaccharide deacetylase family protein [Neorhizobium lilium]